MPRLKKKLITPEALDAAYAKQYAKGDIDPSMRFPLEFPVEVLFEEELKTKKVKKLGVSLAQHEMPTLIAGQFVMGVAPAIAAGSAMISMGFVTSAIPMLAIIALAGIGSLASSKSVGGSIDAFNATTQEAMVSHKSEAKTKAFVKWAKSRYDIDLTEDSVAEMWKGIGTPRFIEKHKQLIKVNFEDYSRFITLAFASPAEKAEHFIEKASFKSKKSIIEKELPLVVDQPLELEYIED